MKHAPFIQNRKTGPSRKYPSPAFLGRKTKTAIKQKTENKEAKKKKTGTKTKQNKLQPYLQQKDEIQMQNSFSIATIIIVFIIIIIISIIIITIIIIAIIIIISRSSIVYHILKASALSCEKQIWELLRFLLNKSF